MAWKIVVIGGGSVLWTPRLSCDMFLEPALDGSELVLVDIEPEAAKLCRDYLEHCVAVLKRHWRISIADEDSALRGADCVVVSISTGGFEAMDKDYTVPERFGVFHTVGDTTGPGGIFRTLRNAPVFLALAQKMSRLCPDAWMLHVTNPLSQITRIVSASGLVRCVGLCHEPAIALGKLREFFGITNPADLDATMVGVNHFTLFTELASSKIKEPMKQLTLQNYLRSRAPETSGSGTVDDLVVQGDAETWPLYLNFFLTEILGVYPAAGSVHIVENFPRFLNDETLLERFKLRRKGVLPSRPARKQRLAGKLQETLRTGAVPPETGSRSREMLADALVGLLAGEPRRIAATLPNRGQVGNLPRDVSVETFAVVTKGGIAPVVSGDIPMSCYGFMASVVAEQELTCEAAVKRDRQLVRQALFASPLLHCKEKTDDLMNALFDAEKAWLDW